MILYFSSSINNTLAYKYKILILSKIIYASIFLIVVGQSLMGPRSSSLIFQAVTTAQHLLYLLEYFSFFIVIFFHRLNIHCLLLRSILISLYLLSHDLYASCLSLFWYVDGWRYCISIYSLFLLFLRMILLTCEDFIEL